MHKMERLVARCCAAACTDSTGSGPDSPCRVAVLEKPLVEADDEKGKTRGGSSNIDSDAESQTVSLAKRFDGRQNLTGRATEIRRY